jgi:choline dehydrogenase-like flavoprotein
MDWENRLDLAPIDNDRHSSFDYVIVGGGTAGCVLARRLSEDGRSTVCLIEAGGTNRSPLLDIPAFTAFTVPRPSRWNWAFESVEQRALLDRKIFQPRGRGLGGSSAINSMVYVRGHSRDYDRWAAQGNPGWSYAEVLPYFKKAENNTRGADKYHGTTGPITISEPPCTHKAHLDFLSAAAEAGYSRNADFNGPELDGFGFFQLNLANGKRSSIAKQYLDILRGKSNLSVISDTQALRITFDDRRATSVICRDRLGNITISATREVIVSCGAFQSPQLLMLSGVGPAKEIVRHGIEVVHDSPGVGQNLQDHVGAFLAYSSPDTTLIGNPLSDPLQCVASLTEFLLHRRGLLTTVACESGGFVRTRRDLERPDVQFFFMPLIGFGTRSIRKGYGYMLNGCALHPFSRGSVTLKSADARDAPEIDPAFLADGRDLELLIQVVKIAKRIAAAPNLAKYRGRDLIFGNCRTDDDIAHQLRRTASTVFHPVGTCRMSSDRDAVVDSQLRVHGVRGLRIADASIMPEIVSGNTQAPTIMIAEKAAAMILAA